jgi:hypothetical protein
MKSVARETVLESLVERRIGTYEYTVTSFNARKSTQDIGLYNNFVLSYKHFFEIFKRNLWRNFEKEHLNISVGKL